MTATMPRARPVRRAAGWPAAPATSRSATSAELTAVNAAARQDGPVRVSPLLAEAISAALRATERTGGDVDPVTGQKAGPQ